MYSVGDTPSQGARASIPAGRYQVTLSGGETFGMWIRCSAIPCSANNYDNVIDYGSADDASYLQVIDVLPSDVAVYLDGITLTQAPA
ncbi:MAG TPA: hypothetical protein VIW24_04115 [Aldersonia sp.]